MRLTNCTSHAINEIREDKLFSGLQRREEGGSIDREREIDLTERSSKPRPSLLFTVDNDLESGAV